MFRRFLCFPNEFKINKNFLKKLIESAKNLTTYLISKKILLWISSPNSRRLLVNCRSMNSVKIRGWTDKYLLPKHLDDSHDSPTCPFISKQRRNSESNRLPSIGKRLRNKIRSNELQFPNRLWPIGRNFRENFEIF